MITIRRLCILTISMGLHVAAIATALVISGSAVDSAILVDLVAGGIRQARPEARQTVETRARTRVERPPRARSPRQESTAPPASLSPVALTPPAESDVRSLAPDVARASAPEAPRETVPTPPATEPAPAASTGQTTPYEPLAAGVAQGRAGSGASVSGSASYGSAPGSDRPGATATTGARGDGSNLAAATAGTAHGGIPPEYDPYLRRFRRRVQESINYPLAARRQGLAGIVELEVLLDPSGRIAGVSVVASSSHALLDEAALQAVKRVAPEPMPDQLPRRPLRIRLPLAFELQ